MDCIYLDNNATTPLDPRVLEHMLPFLAERFGNPASTHHHVGRDALRGVERAREHVADLIGASADEIVWTSGATESCNLAIKGIARHYRDKGRHIITQVSEHPAVLDTCKALENEGFRVTRLPVDHDGLIDLNGLEDALADDTVLVSIMLANNETGTIQPGAQIGALCKRRGVLFHSDVTQALGKLAVDVEALNLDLASASAHKLYGPKGAGMLYLGKSNPPVRCDPILHGGGHERGLRSGTLNVPGIVGFGEAARICGRELAEESDRLMRLRDRLHAGLEGALGDITLNGHRERRLCNTLNLSFAGLSGETLIEALTDIAVSSGAACSGASPGPSHVLQAMRLTPPRIYGSIRFSLGRFNTDEEIDCVIGKVSEAARSLKGA